MRFHTTHLMLFVATVAVVCAVTTQPDLLAAVLVPLIGGLCVVLPVLGTIELLTPRCAILPNPGWRGTLLVIFVGFVGCLLAAVVGAWVIARISGV